MFRNSIRMVSVALVMSAICGGAASPRARCSSRTPAARTCSGSAAAYIPDVGAIVACLRGNEPRLSEACHQVMFFEASTSSTSDRARHPHRRRSIARGDPCDCFYSARA